MLGLLVLACVDPEPQPLDTGGFGSVPDYVDPTVEPVWTQAEAATAVEDALAGQLPDPRGLVGTLDEWLAHGDASCPGGEGSMLGELAILGCETAEGYAFSGIGGWNESGSADDEVMGISVVAELRMASPDEADVFEAGLEWSYLAARGPEGWGWGLELHGSLIQESHGEEWIAQGVSSYLDLAGIGERLEDGSAVGNAVLSGGLQLGDTQLHFDQLGLGMPDCAGVPQGELAIRDPGEGWWRYDFGDCDQCEVSFDREPVPDANCPDLAELSPRLVGVYLP